jgi:hypothetical protein
MLRQVIVRSLTEQLASEANAVLRDHSDLISPDDEVGPGASPHPTCSMAVRNDWTANGSPSASGGRRIHSSSSPYN